MRNRRGALGTADEGRDWGVRRPAGCCSCSRGVQVTGVCLRGVLGATMVRGVRGVQGVRGQVGAIVVVDVVVVAVAEMFSSETAEMCRQAEKVLCDRRSCCSLWWSKESTRDVLISSFFSVSSVGHVDRGLLAPCLLWRQTCGSAALVCWLTSSALARWRRLRAGTHAPPPHQPVQGGAARPEVNCNRCDAGRAARGQYRRATAARADTRRRPASARAAQSLPWAEACGRAVPCSSAGFLWVLLSGSP